MAISAVGTIPSTTLEPTTSCNPGVLYVLAFATMLSAENISPYGPRESFCDLLKFWAFQVRHNSEVADVEEVGLQRLGQQGRRLQSFQADGVAAFAAGEGIAR